jgi:hypothetical protein
MLWVAGDSGRTVRDTYAGAFAVAARDPRACSTNAQIVEINVACGQERIEAQWGSGPTLRRNYFRTVLESGQW